MRRSNTPILSPLSLDGGGLLRTDGAKKIVGGDGIIAHKYRRVTSLRHSQLLQRLAFGLAGLLLVIFAMTYITMARRAFLGPTLSTDGSGKARILHQPVQFITTERDHATTRGIAMKPTANHGLKLCSYCLPKKPRSVGYYFSERDPSTLVGLERLDPNLLQTYDSSNTRFRRQFMTKEEQERQEDLENSEDYSSTAADTIHDQGKDCVPQYDWQESFFPTCNYVLEVDVTHIIPQVELFNHEDETEEDGHQGFTNLTPSALPSLGSSTGVQLISSGYWRNVWSVKTNLNGPVEFAETYVLKTMRYKHDYTSRNFDRHRRDAVAMERLTASPFVMDIYAACGTSGLFEYADGGSLQDSISSTDAETEPWTSQERLVVAYQAAAGIADLHNVGKEGVASIVHTDITLDQFVYVQNVGVYKLNDFNRARFIGWNNRTNVACEFHVGNNPGGFRSPEEYAYKGETEKVDVYSLGNVFYGILTKLYPFEGIIKGSEGVQQTIMNGGRPPIPESILNSTDPFDKAMLKAIEMCWVQQPTERATAREVQNYINQELKRLGVPES